MECWYQNRVTGDWSSFLQEFLKNIHRRFWFLTFLKKVKFWGLFQAYVAYVHIDYSTYQFSEESKGGGGAGWNPPPVLAVPKKAGS